MFHLANLKKNLCNRSNFWGVHETKTM
jgi:hypothetical protein